MTHPIRIDRLVRSRRRTLALIVTPRAELVVRAPRRMPRAEIDRFMREKEAWIRRKLREAQQTPLPAPRQFANGETLLYLGRACTIEYAGEDSGAVHLGETLRLAEESRSRARETLERWYRLEAARILPERCRRYSASIGKSPSAIRITGARRRWGSCNLKGRVCFSWRLIQAPLDVVDYVVVHELAHLLHPNHSRRFWAAVARILPDFKARQEWLKRNSVHFF
jgi:predicted metal-dependent hydrolase